MTAIPQLAFTGHRNIRPQDLGELLQSLSTLAERASADTWHTGGAAGLDTQALQIGLMYKRIHNVLHIPFDYQRQALVRNTALRHVDNWTNCTQPGSCDSTHWDAITGRNKFQRRNEHMVDSADTLFAYYTGQPGGTRNCIQYALLKGKPVIDLMSGYAITHL